MLLMQSGHSRLVKKSLFNEKGDNNSTDSNTDSNTDSRTEYINSKMKIEINLTSKGKEIASKINEINESWEDLIYNNIEASDKEEIMKNLKDLTVSSLKINEKEDIEFKEEVELGNFRNKFKKNWRNFLGIDLPMTWKKSVN